MSVDVHGFFEKKTFITECYCIYSPVDKSSLKFVEGIDIERCLH